MNDKNISIFYDSNVLKEIDKAFYDIPFGNSDFQNFSFMMCSQITPERAYRSLGLKLKDRLSSLRTAKYAKMKMEVEVERKRHKIADEKTDYFDRKLLEIELMELEESLPDNEKLINDCIHECNFLYSLFVKFPRYTRKDFERGEEMHFVERSKRQVFGLEGGKETLINIMQDKKVFEQTLTMLENAKPEDYERIALEMKNKIFTEGNVTGLKDPSDFSKIGK